MCPTIAEEPGNELAQEIAASFAHRDIASVRRFSTGLCHYVFEAAVQGERPLVVRIAKPENERLLAGAVYWEKRLRTAGIPVARILHADLKKEQFPFAYLILERLDGNDLEDVYPRMSSKSQYRLGQQMAAIQSTIAAFPEGATFGDALSYDEPSRYASWQRVVEANIETCRGRIQGDSVLQVADVALLESAASSLDQEFSKVEARPFLDDTTTKNVIVAPSGDLSGIVDVDTVCFGDRLFPLALTRAAFAKLGFDPVYTDAWAAMSHPDDKESRRLSFYTALFAAILLSEEGLRFNRTSAVDIGRTGIERLKELFAAQLKLTV